MQWSFEFVRMDVFLFPLIMCMPSLRVKRPWTLWGNCWFAAWTTDLKNDYMSVSAWTGSISADSQCGQTSIIIIIKHQPASSAAGCMRTILHQRVSTHTHSIAIIAPLLVSHSHFLQPGAKSRPHLWKWPLKAWGCYKQDPSVPLGWVAGGSRLTCQHGE